MFLCVFLCSAFSFARADAQAHKTLSNSIGMEFIEIPAGTFIMGSKKEGAIDNEKPRHTVTISRPFFLGKYEVTQEQWETIMGNNPSKSKRYGNPVEMVSWHDVHEFIRRLNKRENTLRYRLPTEAEWEYAARAGVAYGEEYIPLDKQKEPNPWGLYNMHGGVWEWVQDWYDENYYANSPIVDPPGPLEGTYRIVRGGIWLEAITRSAYRYPTKPRNKKPNVGFRLAFSPEDEAAKK
jgi:formylglycine-generating enzyme required for sulfatase activity